MIGCKIEYFGMVHCLCSVYREEPEMWENREIRGQKGLAAHKQVAGPDSSLNFISNHFPE